MPPSDQVRTRSLAAFLRFAGLSGAGWLLDALLLLGLVSWGGWHPFGANVVSSCTAATTVFLLSRQMIFQKASRALLLRLTVYVCYSLGLILVASAAVAAIVQQLSIVSLGVPAHWTHFTATAVAKVLVTPPQLILNFFVSRFLAERSLKRQA